MDSTVMVRTIDNASVVTVIGDVDIHTAAALLDTISPLIGSGKRVIVDLTGVGFLDSSGLSVFVTALKRAKEKNARIALVITDPRVLKDPPPNVVFREFAASALNFRCFGHVEDISLRFQVQNDLHMRITEVFRERGIEIAYPQMDLHLRSVDPGAGDRLSGQGV